MRLPHLGGRLPAAAAFLGVVLAGSVGLWLLVGERAADDEDPAVLAASPTNAASPTRLPPPSPATPAPDVAGARNRADPVAFARAVGDALFAWDTTMTESADVRGRLLAVADPTGVESPGLVSDLDGYVPTAASWEHLRQYATRQWLEISTAAEPAGWGAARASAPSGAITPGTSAVTVTGTRHRAGVWEDAPVASRHDVAFTVFVVCGPTYPTCYLLRLSELDNPLT